jgi:hypothetical protein
MVMDIFVSLSVGMKLVSIVRQVLCNKGLSIFIIHKIYFCDFVVSQINLCGNSAGATGCFVSNHVK